MTDPQSSPEFIAAKLPARHPQADEPDTIWSAVGRPLTGLGPQKVRLTADMLYFEHGVLTTDAQQVQTWEIHDVDSKQTMLQRPRGVGTITVHTARRGGRPEWVLLVDVPDFREGVRLINETARLAIDRRRHEERTQNLNYSGATVTPVPQAVPSASVASDGFLEQLQRLGVMKEQGLLTDEEFAAAKARLLGL